MLKFISLFLFLAPVFLSAQSHSVQRQNANQLEKQGNYKEALVIYEKLISEDLSNVTTSSDDLSHAVNCLNRLRQREDFDSLVSKFLELRKDSWEAYAFAGHAYIDLAYHNGRLVNGQFKRGYNSRYRGVYVYAEEYDRSKAVSLYEKALSLLPADNKLSAIYSSFARAIFWNRSHGHAYMLQDKTDTQNLPDLTQAQYHGYNYGSNSKAPVDEEGNPVFHKVPESYEKAETDGERWRWLLKKAADNGDPEGSKRVYADFLYSQFSVESLREYSWYFNSGNENNKESILALDKLTDEETLAKLAGGIKKFTMPEEHNFIKLYKELAEKKHTSAYRKLGNIYLNRRQFKKSAEIWKKILELNPNDQQAKKQLEQITGNWGEFVSVSQTVHGRKPEFDFRFRNATKVKFRATRINMKKLIDDTISYIKTKPEKLDWDQVSLYNYGRRILEKNQQKYLSPEVEVWEEDLKPAADHFNRRITLEAKFSRSGTWLLESQIENGNKTHILVEISSIIAVKNSLNGKTHFYIADAETGKPLKDTAIELFGYYQEYKGRDGNKRKYEIHLKELTKTTNENGQIYLSNAEVKTEKHYYNWMIKINKDDHFTHWGFNSIYGSSNEHNHLHDHGFRSYIVTDRPVYKPGQKVQFKVWTANSSYDPRRHQSFQGSQSLKINDPKGKELFKSSFDSDKWGGFSGSYNIPADATLGHYHIYTKHGSFSFRIEEYKKPEFAVTVLAPDKPVALGEKMPVTVQAKYYFGAPVSKGTVKIKVHRSEHFNSWYPAEPWDWFYGPGYGWCGEDYEWYPGWRSWGCKSPRPFWIPWNPEPPELVMEMDARVDDKGEVKFVIDSSVAKALYGDKSHEYKITAEVTDESRRTIVGGGSVIATADPFKVFVWTDRSYYQTGQAIDISYLGRTASGKTVDGKAELKLYEISYDKDGKASEKEIDSQKADINKDSENKWKLTAAKAGQYRVSCKITAENGKVIEGAALFSVFGKDTNAENFKFNRIELLTDKKTYAPGDTVKLKINTERNNSTVLLFVRPQDGVYPDPKVIHIEGKSTTLDIKVGLNDQPNFFLEAFTVSEGILHSLVKQIFVPPADKMLNVDIKPDKNDYRPGQMANYTVTLTGPDGKPKKGTFCFTVYDQSLDYIAGDSAQRPIKEYYWSWKRSHYPGTNHNLRNYFRMIILDYKHRMQQLGIFGNVGEELSKNSFGGKGGVEMEDAKSEKKADAGMDNAAPAMQLGEAQDSAAKSVAADKDMNGTAEMENVKIRKDFADTAFWDAKVDTDSNGKAVISFKMPENLTAWKTRCWGVGNGFTVGESENIVTTSKKIIIRLQAPRFFVETDEVTVSTNVHNYLDTKQTVKVRLQANPLLKALSGLEQEVTIPAGGEQRVDFRMQVIGSGEVVLKAFALTKDESDAVEMKFPAKVHGILKMDSFSGFISRNKNSALIDFTVPDKIDPEYSLLEVRYSPSLALSMVSALPYLANFPYGCTEQTLNRFLPTSITHKILKGMNLDLEDIRQQLSNLNAQETGNDLQRLQRWERLKQHQKDKNPVFDIELVKQMERKGLKDLLEMQLNDGGWGWFSGYGERSSAHTTAYVVNGLLTAIANGAEVDPNALKRGVNWLKEYQEEQTLKIRNYKAEKKDVPKKAHADNLDAFVFMVLANAAQKQYDEMAGYLYTDRNKISLYGKSMLALAFHHYKDSEKVTMLRRNIEQFLVNDKENQTSYLKMDNGSYWWYWYGSEWETHAYYLKLLAKVDPNSETASGLVKYLVNNRRNSYYWNSTRDTALCIEAIADYITATKEDKPDMTVEILVDGKKIGEETINSKNLFTFNNKIILDQSKISSGKHKLELRRKGSGPVYFNAYMTYFSKEDYIKKAGLEIKVQRTFYKLVRKEDSKLTAGVNGKVIKARQEAYERILIKDLDTVKSGDLIEVELEIDSKNDYEYIVFEDLKAAGFEAFDVRSGYTRNGFHAYREMRNDRVSFFVSQLPRGKHNIKYRLRAEIPGKFSALPAKVYANYAPELKGNSDEIKISIID